MSSTGRSRSTSRREISSPKQFHYFFSLRKSNKTTDPYVIAGSLLTAMGAIWAFLTADSIIFPIIILLLGVLLLLPGVRKRLRKGKSRAYLVEYFKIEVWINLWSKINGPIPKMLPPPVTRAEPAQLNPDLSAYSFDRVVVCDHASIAQFLIANNFHFENNCAVLSIDKYPQNIFDTVMEMLRRNPELKVYALHDASPEGVRMVDRLLRDPAWFKGSNVTVYDLGLLPRQLFNRPNFTQESLNSPPLSPTIRARLLPEEVKWLEEGTYVELESLSPRVLLNMVRQGIGKSRDPRAEDALVPVDTSSTYGGDVHLFIYDSFG